MSDIKKKLDRVKKEREARAKTLSKIKRPPAKAALDDGLENQEVLRRPGQRRIADKEKIEQLRKRIKDQARARIPRQDEFSKDVESETESAEPEGVQGDGLDIIDEKEVQKEEVETHEAELKALEQDKTQPGSTRSQLIEDSWEKLKNDETLSVKDKLEQLISLTRRERAERPKTPAFEPIPREPLKVLENPYPLNVRYGRISISAGLDIGGDILACLANEPAFEILDLSTALFLDLETTGLSGGAGVIPFLVGMGFYRDERFYVSQYFLGDPGEEERMIAELAQIFEDKGFRSVVTFNGKAFDIPLLETRFIIHRTPFRLSELPHLDFLFPARSLWKHKFESCRLFHLAQEVVRTDRAEDIPSAEIPWRYFQYLQTGNYELIEPILYHNQEDILSLLGVVIVGAHIFSENPDACLVDAMDFYGAGKILEKRGDAEKSLGFFQRALDGKLTEDVLLQAKKRMSAHFKKGQAWDQAVALWQEMSSLEYVSIDQLFSIRELAMHLEHREKKYEEAKKFAEEGFVLSMGYSAYYEKDFKHRLERLNQKIRKKKDKKP